MYAVDRLLPMQELSRGKSSLAWEDGEGASVVEASPDETGVDKVLGPKTER